MDYCLRKFTNIVDKLLVYPDAMKANIEKTGGLIFSQRLLLAIVSKGVLREDAYKWVQRNAMAKWMEGQDFKTNVFNDEDIKKYLSHEEIEACFEYSYYLRYVDTVSYTHLDVYKRQHYTKTTPGCCHRICFTIFFGCY